MKFIIFLFVILYIYTSSALSFSINKNIVKREESNKLVVKNVNVNVNRNNLNISLECRNDLNRSTEYKECSDIHFTLSNYEYLCSILNSSKCQKFYENPFSYIPNCKNEEVMVDLLSEPMISTTKASVSLICSKDGKGNLCPAAEVSLQGKIIDSEAINQTCQSKKCISALSDMLKSSLDNIDAIQYLSFTTINDVDSAKKIFSALLNNIESEACLSQAVDETETETFSLNMSIILIYTLGVLIILNIILFLYIKKNKI